MPEAVHVQVPEQEGGGDSRRRERDQITVSREETSFLVFSYRNQAQLSNLVTVPETGVTSPSRHPAVSPRPFCVTRRLSPHAAQGAGETFFRICRSMSFSAVC